MKSSRVFFNKRKRTGGILSSLINRFEGLVNWLSRDPFTLIVLISRAFGRTLMGKIRHFFPSNRSTKMEMGKNIKMQKSETHVNKMELCR